MSEVNSQGRIIHDPSASQTDETLNDFATSPRCLVCGRPLGRGATKYCGLECYRVVQRATLPADRFQRYVNRTPGCWWWTGAVGNQYGHGAFVVTVAPGEHRHVYAHRFAWELANGPIPDGRHVLHSCDEPRCVNPAHLFLGDQDANMKDAARKGRLHVPRPSRQKVSAAGIADIVARVAAGEKRYRLAREYGVSKAWVGQLVAGKRGQLRTYLSLFTQKASGY